MIFSVFPIILFVFNTLAVVAQDGAYRTLKANLEGVLSIHVFPGFGFASTDGVIAQECACGYQFLAC